MLDQSYAEGRFNDATPWLVPLDGPASRPRRLGLRQEQRWRNPGEGTDEEQANVQATRWTDHATATRREQATAPTDRYVVGIALKPARLRLASGGVTLFEGTMPAGTLHVTAPGQHLEAEFRGSCDFIHLHVAAGYLHNRQAALAEPDRALGDLMVRDPAAMQLVRTLTEGSDGGDALYAESVGQTVVMRLLTLRRPCSPPRVAALPKWRLRRVQDHIDANIGEPVMLAHLAGAAGLSRMHFAAQFRAATGCSPHEYLLQQRIERAKSMLLSGTGTKLAEVALDVGFQTQSHFSTVFKRITGETPARWQRGGQGS